MKHYSLRSIAMQPAVMKKSEVKSEVAKAVEGVESVAKDVRTAVTNQYHNVQEYLRDADIRAAANKAAALARRHPVAATAVGVGLGVIISRLLVKR
jgi:ElaB/YqjD/DUF883 family membrane-anchored ribosome-binding protein